MINFKNILNSLLVLLLLVSFFSIQSCKKKEEKKIYGIDYHRGNAEEEVDLTEVKDDSDPSSVEEDTYYDSSNYDDDFSVSEIRSYLKRERYKKVISTLKNSDGSLAKYYKGIAYFSMSKNHQRYSLNERISYKEKANDLLLVVIDNTTDDELKARALMWLSILIHISNTDRASKMKALRYLAKIENTLSHTSSYGDSLVVQASVYRYLGKIKKAANIYYKIATVKGPYIYDYETKKYFSPRGASEYFLKAIWWIPQDSSYSY